MIDLFWLRECHYYLIFLGRWLSWTRSIRRGWNINMLWKRCYQFLFLIMKWSIFYLASCEIFECQKIQPQFKNMLTDDRGVLLLYVVEVDAKSAAIFWLLMNFEFKIHDFAGNHEKSDTKIYFPNICEMLCCNSLWLNCVAVEKQCKTIEIWCLVQTM